jgi:uncharacterized protein
MRRLMTSTLIIALSLYAMLVVLLYMNQDRMLFAASRDHRSPAEIGLAEARELYMKTPDGETLVAWHRPPDEGMPTMLFFHGNGGTISNRSDRFEFYAERGLGILFVEYRGYGASTGKAGEAGFKTDARTAYDWLLSQDIVSSNIVIVGESLGTAVATQLASDVRCAALLLEAPYNSVVDVAADRYWFVPVRLLIKHRFDAGSVIGQVRAPVLIQHGTRDSTIPIRFAKALFASAGEPKTFVEIPDGTHLIFNEDTWMRSLSFLNEKLSLSARICVAGQNNC